MDFATLNAAQPLPRADAAFCCLGTTIKKAGSQVAFRAVDYEAVLRFAQAAKAGGTERLFVVTARGADAASWIFYNRVKGEVEAALGALELATLGIARPSLLLGDRSDPRPLERLAVTVSRRLSPIMAPLGARPIEARTVARALIAMAETPAQGTRAYDNSTLHAMGR